MEVDQIVEESLKLSRFKHDHVMCLIGVCIDAGSTPYIVTPYMAKGSLLRYLKGERGSLVLSQDANKKDVCRLVYYYTHTLIVYFYITIYIVYLENLH